MIHHRDTEAQRTPKHKPVFSVASVFSVPSGFDFRRPAPAAHANGAQNPSNMIFSVSPCLCGEFHSGAQIHHRDTEAQRTPKHKPVFSVASVFSVPSGFDFRRPAPAAHANGAQTVSNMIFSVSPCLCGEFHSGAQIHHRDTEAQRTPKHKPVFSVASALSVPSGFDF